MVTAVVDAGGAETLTSPAATLAAYRPALYLITGVAALGLLAALPGLRRIRVSVPDQVIEFRAGETAAGETAAGETAAGETAAEIAQVEAAAE